MEAPTARPRGSRKIQFLLRTKPKLSEGWFILSNKVPPNYIFLIR